MNNPSPATPTLCEAQGKFRLFRFRSPLLAESLSFSSPSGTWMFSSPEFPHAASRRTQNSKLKSKSQNLKNFEILVTVLTVLGFPIRKPPDQRLVGTSPALSLPPASFFSSCYQGIHHLLYGILKMRLPTLIKDRFQIFKVRKWSQPGLNRRPSRCKRDALPAEL